MLMHCIYMYLHIRFDFVMRACAEQALRNMMDMYIYFLFMYVSQSNLVLPVSLSGLITLA